MKTPFLIKSMLASLLLCPALVADVSAYLGHIEPHQELNLSVDTNWDALISIVDDDTGQEVASAFFPYTPCYTESPELAEAPYVDAPSFPIDFTSPLDIQNLRGEMKFAVISGIPSGNYRLETTTPERSLQYIEENHTYEEFYVYHGETRSENNKTWHYIECFFDFNFPPLGY